MSDVVCRGCGSTQPAGAPFCAVCGHAFPRTGRPVDVPPDMPVGEVQRAHRSAASGPGEPVRLEHTGTTEQEVVSATQIPARPAPVAAASGPPPYAHVGRRIVAYLVDAAVAGLLSGLVLGIGMVFVDVPTDVTSPQDPQFQALLGQLGTVLAVAALVSLAYGIGMLVWEGLSGRTVGNLALGIRTLGVDDGLPVGFGRALLRWLVVAACSLVPGIGTLLVLLSPLWDGGGRSQGWHDKAGRAVVVRVRATAPAPAPRAAAPRAGAPASPPGPTAGAVPAPGAPAPAPAVAPAPGGHVSAAPPAPVAPSAPATARPGPSATPGAEAPASASWSPPGPAAQPAAPGAADGLITSVPGMGGGAAPAAPAAPADEPTPQTPTRPEPEAPPAPTPAPEPVATPAPTPAAASESESESANGAPDEHTRMAPTSERQEMRPAEVAPVVLELESGERIRLEGTARVGRNPEAAPGETVRLVRIEDPSRSVSKNHADLGVDSAGLWLADRGSTNGTVVSAVGSPPRVAEPGARVRVPDGSTVHVGDRRITVHREQA